MNVSDDLMAEMIEALNADGDAMGFTGPDGGTYLVRLTVGGDPDASINDYESYGQLSPWTRNNGTHGYSQRPSGFGPHARIIGRDRGFTQWWQPLPEVWGTPKPWRPEMFEGDWKVAKRIYEDGFVLVGVSLHETVQDSWGNDHLVEVCSQWLGGVDDTTADTIRDVVSDLLAELFDEGGES